MKHLPGDSAPAKGTDVCYWPGCDKTQRDGTGLAQVDNGKGEWVGICPEHKLQWRKWGNSCTPPKPGETRVPCRTDFEELTEAYIAKCRQPQTVAPTPDDTQPQPTPSTTPGDPRAAIYEDRDGTRMCRGCETRKPLVTGFYRDENKRGGFDTKCKECRRTRRQQLRDEQRDERLGLPSTASRRVRKTPEQLAAQKYYRKNRKAILARQKARRAESKAQRAMEKLLE